MDLKELKKLINEVKKERKQISAEQQTAPGRKNLGGEGQTIVTDPEHIGTVNDPRIGSSTQDMLRRMSANVGYKQSQKLPTFADFSATGEPQSSEDPEDPEDPDDKELPLVGTPESQAMKKKYENKPGFTKEEWQAMFPELSPEEVEIRRQDAIAAWAEGERQKVFDLYYQRTHKPHPDDKERIKSIQMGLERTAFARFKDGDKTSSGPVGSGTAHTSRGYVDKILKALKGRDLEPNEPTVTRENKNIQQESKIKIRIK